MSSSKEQGSSLDTFAALWAIAVLAHYWFIPAGDAFHSLKNFFDFSTLLIAFVVLLSPHRFWGMLLLGVLQLVTVWFGHPDVSNHWLLVGFVNACLIGSATFCIVTSGSRDFQSSVAEIFIPLGRVCCIVLYAFAFFWKLNWGFIDESQSCAIEFYQHIRILHPFFPAVSQGLASFLIFLTLVTEGMLIVLLIIPSLRVWGVLVAACFHFLLLLDVHQQLSNFSWVMFPLLSLFVLKEIKELSQAHRAKFDDLLKRASGPGTAALFLGIYVAGALTPVRAADWWFLNQQLALTMLAAALVVFACRILVRSFAKSEVVCQYRFRNIPILLWIFPIAMIANGLLPVLGLKTGNAWQMYSNVKFGAKETNHFVIRRTGDVFGFLSDEVEILQLNKQTESIFVQRSERLPFFEFARICATSDCSGILYQRSAEKILSDGKSESEWYRRQPLLLRKVVRLPREALTGKCYW